MFYVSDITGAQTLYSQATAVTQSGPASRPQEVDSIAGVQATEATTSYRNLAETSRTDPRTGAVNPSIANNSALANPLSVGTAGAGIVGPEGRKSSGSRSKSSRVGLRQDVEPTEKAHAIDFALEHGVSQLPENLHRHANPYSHLDQSNPIREPALLVSQIMISPVITLRVDDSVETAWKLFHDKKFRHVPVISKEGKLVGILSDRDFLSLGIGRIGQELSRQEQLKRPINEVMTTNVITTRPNAEIRYVAKVMFLENIGAMPVVSDKLELVGIVTNNDILRTLIKKAPLELWI